MRKFTLTALALLACSGAAWSAATPQASRYDTRMQQVSYNGQNVTVVNTKAGFMTTLVFDDDEAVISAKPGFDEAWEATPDANRVYIRPVAVAQGAPGEDANASQVVIPPNARDWHTNLFVVTSKRFYNVELNVIDDKSPQQPAFQVTYRYPGEARDKANREAAARQREWEVKHEQASVQKTLAASQVPRNWDYWKRTGKDSAQISPAFVYDDGRFTFIGFSPQHNIPSVFRFQNGREQVVNSSVQRKGNFTVLVVQETTPRLVLRSGDAVVGLENRSFGKVRATDGTTVSPRVDRVEKQPIN